MRARPWQTGTRIGTRLAACLFGLTLVAGCGGDSRVHHQRVMVFGTLVDISLYGLAAEDAEPLLATIEDELQTRHETWHAWQTSPLTELNASLNDNGEATIPEPLLPLFDRGLPLARATDYRFDPAVGGLVRLWGFHQEPAEDAEPPGDEALAEWRDNRPSVADLERDGRELRSDRRDWQMDFGGVAKGIALAQVRRRIAEAEPDAAIVNAGGDLVTYGQPGGRAWRIGVRNPTQGELLGELAVHRDEAAFTTGDYERGFEHEGTRYHHVLDPRTGRPARGLRAVTVLAEDPAKADAAATALLIAGPDNWQELASQLDLDRVLVVRPDRSIRATPGMAKRFEASDTVADEVVTVSLP